jgi:hypothetical protein
MVREPEDRKEIVARPSSPGITSKTIEQWKPAELDPELANLAMAKLLVEKLGTPSRIKKEFIVRKAIFKALNHIPDEYSEIPLEKSDLDNMFVDRNPIMLKKIRSGNPTGYDSSLRLQVYDSAELGSVNEDGLYFDRVWAFLMKPKYIINGMAGMGGLQEEEKGESLIGRAINWFRGGKKNAGSPNNPQ